AFVAGLGDGARDGADVVNLRFGVSASLARTLYAASDGVLANSVSEPFGLVGLEAMAAGGVAYTGGTGEDYAIAGRNAIVLETLDPGEIIRHWEELASSRRSVGRAPHGRTIVGGRPSTDAAERAALAATKASRRRRLARWTCRIARRGRLRSLVASARLQPEGEDRSVRLGVAISHVAAEQPRDTATDRQSEAVASRRCRSLLNAKEFLEDVRAQLGRYSRT